MTRLTIELPDDLRSKVAVRAAETGHDKIEDFVQALLQSDVSDELLDEEVEAELVRRLESGPGFEATPEFFQGLRDSIQARLKRS